MKNRISTALLNAVSQPWVTMVAGTAAAIALMIALGLPAEDAIRIAGPMNSGTGGS